MQLLIITAIVFAIGSVVFAMQNTLHVTVTFLLWHFDSSLAMVLLLSMACGAFVVALLSTPSTLRARWQLARQRRQITKLEDEVAALKQRANLAEDRPGLPPAAPSPPYVGLKTLLTTPGFRADGEASDR